MYRNHDSDDSLFRIATLTCDLMITYLSSRLHGVKVVAGFFRKCNIIYVDFGFVCSERVYVVCVNVKSYTVYLVYTEPNLYRTSVYTER